MPSPEGDYASVIADLERRRDELDRMISSLRALAGQPFPTGGPPPSGGTTTTRTDLPRELRSDAFFNMKAPEAIKAFLLIVKGPRTVREIADGLTAGGFLTGAKNAYNNLYTALIRMQEAEEVVQVPGKKWGLADWYPARPKKKESDSGAKEDDTTKPKAGKETAA